MVDIESRTGIVTGASSGIGRASAIAFASAGANVVISARRKEAGEETAHEAEKAGGRCLFLQGDVSEPAHCQALVSEAVRHFGRLDFAFNNAGIEGDAWIPTGDYDIEVFDKVVAINLRGVFLSMRYQLPELVKTRGSIVNMASIAGLIGGKVGCAYYATKHGVIGLTKAAAAEYAPKGVRVNAIAPAVVRTELTERLFFFDEERGRQVVAGHPIGRVGTPEEIAHLVMFLCSENAGFITGETVKIDGGRTIGPL